MQFKMIIDKEKEEEVLAIVHEKTRLVEEIEALVQEAENPTRINGYGEDDIRVLSIPEIESVYVEDGKTYARYSDGSRYQLKKRLYEVENILPSDFIRINKSAIANKKKIKRFKTAISGVVDVEFKSGHTEYVSRRCFADLRRRYHL